MTRAEAEVWMNALAAAALGLWCDGDDEGKAFLDECGFLLCEFVFDAPIQRKPY